MYKKSKEVTTKGKKRTSAKKTIDKIQVTTVEEVMKVLYNLYYIYDLICTRNRKKSQPKGRKGHQQKKQLTRSKSPLSRRWWKYYTFEGIIYYIYDLIWIWMYSWTCSLRLLLAGPKSLTTSFIYMQTKHPVKNPRQ